MSNWEKSLRDQQKQRKYPKNPSFSSILLDEMFRSIDGNDEKFEDFNVYKDQSTRKNTTTTITTNNNNGVFRDEEMASLKRACLMEKFMEKKVSSRRTSSLPEMESTRSLQNDNDYHPTLFSTSSSSSSDSSSNGFSTSDVEFYGSGKSRTSCFSSSVKAKPNKSNEYYSFDDYGNHQTSRTEDHLIKNKSRALKIYSNLKKVKQPISPGGRLTNFINSLFANGNGKKTKNTVSINGGSLSNNAASTCSSASSYSRSCLSKNEAADHNSRSNYINNGVQKTVRFYPDSQKSIYEDGFGRHGRKIVADQTVAEVKSRIIEKNKKMKEGSRDLFKGYQNQIKDHIMMERIIHKNGRNYEDDDDDDAASDASSDLFEIDHLALFGGDKRFCDELPVYETTHLQRNRAIAMGF